MFSSYHAIFITLGLLAVYLLSRFLVKKGRLSLSQHRKFWNIILAITFIAAAILGLILAVVIDRQIIITHYRVWLWLHVEFGISMTAVGIIHFLWHIRYYWQIIKNKNEIQK